MGAMNVSLPSLCVLIAVCAASPALAESTINIECSIPAQNHTLPYGGHANTSAQVRHFQVSVANGWNMQEWEFVFGPTKVRSSDHDQTSTIRISRTTGDLSEHFELFFKDGSSAGTFTMIGKCRLVSTQDKLF